MEDDGLATALERAEYALKRIQRSLDQRDSAPPPAAGRDEELRARLREAVAELDELIREAAH